MSLLASTRGVGLLPAYAEKLSAFCHDKPPLQGVAPNIDLVFGYNKANQSPVLKLLLSRLDELVARVSKKVR